ncbi:MAG TPA: pyridoxamine 5'-phosphate oxidase family protein [Thermoanaerobaculia bacterium]
MTQLSRVALLVVLVGCSAQPVPSAPGTELYRVESPEAILQAARSLMEADGNMALVTVDDDGQPRVRTVRAFLTDVDPADPGKGMTVWVMTRQSTRKVEQVRNHPRVTLYFNDDVKFSYLTIMGTGIVHTDPSVPAVQPFLKLEGYKEFFWPNFPEGFVMIEVRPHWIEFMGPGIRNHQEHWRPQSVVFPAR